MKRNAVTGTAAAFSMFLLIIDAKTALQGAQEGIRLCLMTVIPSLFPFFILSALLTSAVSGGDLRILRPIGKLCRMPEGSEGVFLTGLLGGYPTGAQAVTQLYQDGQLTKPQAQRLLGFCCNAGPAFIFGICGSMFPKAWMVWLLWLIHLLSAIIVGILLPYGETGCVRSSKRVPMSLPKALDRAVKTTARVCGWVLLFRIIIGFLNRWALWILDPGTKTLICGILELTNGCALLHTVENAGLRFVLVSGFLSFGGICVWMQTVSVVENLGTKTYLSGKALQTCVSILIALLLQWSLFPEPHQLRIDGLAVVIAAISAIFPAVFLIKWKIRGSNPALYGV